MIPSVLVYALVASVLQATAAFESRGTITFAGLPVPGATVTATHGSDIVVTSSDADGRYLLRGLRSGVWVVVVEMAGFVTITGKLTLPAQPGVPPPSWQLTMKPLAEMTRSVPGPATIPAPRAAAPPSRAPGPADEPASDAAADGFVINGSVNNAAASPFAQPRAFGNNRPQAGSRYSGALAVVGGSSILDARPFSFTGGAAPRPSYGDVRVLGTLGGPIRLPGVTTPASRFFIGYQGSRDHTVSTASAVMPTLLERRGDFSRRVDAAGQPVLIRDPVTGQPFAGNLIPADRIDPHATALLAYYPAPNVTDHLLFDYQAANGSSSRRDDLQLRANHTIRRNILTGNIAYQRTITDATSLFGFEDAGRDSGVDAAINWNRRLNQRLAVRLRYQFTGQSSRTHLYFANRVNVSGDAGITGNDQDPENWGPPRLLFPDVASLTDAQHQSSRVRTDAGGFEAYLSRGRHNVTVGGDVRRLLTDLVSQQDARGTLAFTGAATGAGFADFLLGLPSTSSISFGNADKRFRSSSFDAYVNDDARLTPTVTATIGLRWEYEAPITEASGRLVNLDVAPGFTAISAVNADRPTGGLTGRAYPTSLVRPDRTGFQPRVALAWRPVPGSSLVVRAGYGVYRNTAVYLPIATLLAQQPPLSKTFTVQNRLPDPFTLADAFTAPANATPNTFAVDPGFRVGYAQNWQASVQRDLPASLLVVASYLGSRGGRLMQQFLPNTYPSGVTDPCSTCPAGFVYLTASGTASRHAGRVLLRRRLRNGLGASVQYTLARATDDVSTFGGANLPGAAVAQNWLDLDAERAPSSFDQRHLLALQVEYTTGAGRSASVLSGWRGSLVKGWTLASQLTTGSGLPLTPLILAPVAGTGIIGVRPDLTGEPLEARPSGSYLNPAAYALPAPGQWGSAGRNSVRGPAQFSCDASVARTLAIGDRLGLEWRLDAANVLNRVTYAAIGTIVGSPQFGSPTLANPMRKVQTSLRLRF